MSSISQQVINAVNVEIAYYMDHIPFYPSGLVPAALVEHSYRNVWIRDLYYIGICSEPDVRKIIWQAAVNVLDKYKWKLKHHAEVRPVHAYEYIHVRYSPDGNEIDEPWRHKQWDAIGNWIEICLDEGRYDLAELLVEYLYCVKFYKNPAATAWEDTNAYDAYSFAAVAHALQRAKQALSHKADRISYMVRKTVTRLYNLLPHAARTRHVCLSLLGVVWPFDCAGPYKKEIIQSVKDSLMREPFGFIRYQGDSYDGEFMSRGYGNETPWLLGDCFMAKIEPDNPLWKERINKAYNHFGCMPEAYRLEDMAPNRNTPLIWCEAMRYSILSGF